MVDETRISDQKVETPALETTEQPTARAVRSNPLSGQTASTYVNIVDLEKSDNNNLLNSNQEIDPSETARYRIEAYAQLAQMNADDEVLIRLREIGVGEVVSYTFDAPTSGQATPNFSIRQELDQSSTYVVEVTCDDTDFYLQGTGDGQYTELEVEKCINQA